MRKPRAIVCVSNDLTTDQRVHKTCLTLQSEGFDVTEYGRIMPYSIPLERPYKTKRVKHLFNHKVFFYGELNVRLCLYLLFTKRPSLIVANDLDTLPGAFVAARLRHIPLIYDSHEYFTETPEVINRKHVQRVWKWFEGHIFPKLQYIITVNDSIAKLYHKAYGKQLTVVRNIPVTLNIPEKELFSREKLGLPLDKKVIILQGTGINIDRGGEEACYAMEYIKDAILLIVGDGDAVPRLKEIVEAKQLQDKVIFKSRMPFKELRHYTINSDLGLAIDKDNNINYRYSLPNKLFDYIHSGVPILSSHLKELERIITQYDIGWFIENHEPIHIATIINTIFANTEEYNTKRVNTLIAKDELCWKKEEKKLKELIHKATKQ